MNETKDARSRNVFRLSANILWLTYNGCNAILTSLLSGYPTEVSSEPSQTSKMELFGKQWTTFSYLTILEKTLPYIIDRQDSVYASVQHSVVSLWILFLLYFGVVFSRLNRLLSTSCIPLNFKLSSLLLLLRLINPSSQVHQEMQLWKSLASFMERAQNLRTKKT